MTAVKELSDVDFEQIVQDNSPYTPSPLAWEDHVLYFMMLDRFSDGQEKGYKDINGEVVSTGETPLYALSDHGNAVQNEADAAQWRNAGNVWCGGNLKGLISKLGYLKRLGVSALWLSPIFKQVELYDSYHGYGIQNFLDIDRRFGTKEDLKALVATAHQHNIYVILDIILNHTGDVFAYEHKHMYYWQGWQYQVVGYRDKQGNPTIPFNHPVSDSEFPDGAIWPREFQYPETFSRKGEIRDWEASPEYLDGDFPHPEGLYTLKDVHLGSGAMENYQVSAALKHLAKVYSYWIAYADIDGYRVDTVKHMDKGATRYFASVIHEFAQALGKENFYLIGEITGGRENAFKTMEETGLDAALGINDIPGKLEAVAKGYTNPVEYFELFRHSLQMGKDSHAWFRNKVVTMFDDHDQVRKKENKARFCRHDNGDRLITAVMALNLLTEGIPCIYYGTEQYFDGEGGNDRYIRECMFGGQFGAFRSKARHFFNEDSDLFKNIATMIDMRKNYLTLRRGRQYLREISENGLDFDYPQVIGGRTYSLIAWSRIFNNKEMVIAINSAPYNPRSAWITIDDDLHSVNQNMTCLFSTDAGQINAQSPVKAKNGKAVYISVPPGGAVIFH